VAEVIGGRALADGERLEASAGKGGHREAKQPEIEAEMRVGKVDVEPEHGATSSGSSRESCTAGYHAQSSSENTEWRRR
jgi:hypothetical protein